MTLPMKRERVNYYVIEGRYNELQFMLSMYEEDISPRLKKILNKRKKDLKKYLDDEYGA